MRKVDISFIPLVSAGARAWDVEKGLTSFSDTIDLGEAKPGGVVPALNEFLPCGFETPAMAAPRAEEFDKPMGVLRLRRCQRLRST